MSKDKPSTWLFLKLKVTGDYQRFAVVQVGRTGGRKYQTETFPRRLGFLQPAFFFPQPPRIHSKIPFVSAVTPLALPRGGADIRIMR